MSLVEHARILCTSKEVFLVLTEFLRRLAHHKQVLLKPLAPHRRKAPGTGCQAGAAKLKPTPLEFLQETVGSGGGGRPAQ